MFEKGEISKGQTISPKRANANWILRESVLIFNALIFYDEFL